MQGVVTPTQLKEITPQEAPALVSLLAAIGRLASGGQLLLARLVEASGAPKDAGVRNAGDWIAKTCGTTPTAGREMVKASTQLEKLGVVADAVAHGRLSIDQAKAIADAAAVDSDAEERLVALAPTVSLGELRDECGRTKHAADPDPGSTYERLRRERRLRTFRATDGAWCMSGRGTPDDGAEITAVLDALTDEAFRAARERGAHEPREAYRWDAAVEMARRAWRDIHQHDLDHQGVDDPDQREPTSEQQRQDPDAAPWPTRRQRRLKPPRRKRRKQGVNPRFHACVRIDYAALVRGGIDGEEVCEIPGSGPVPVSVARRILGEAVLDLLVTKGQQVATVVTNARAPNRAQRAALRWMFPECARKGCHRPVAEWDHRDPYAQTPVTVLHNIDGLCHHCHSLKTYDGWALLPGTGKREMVPPTDPRHPGNPTFHRRRRKAA